jgi:hypothetical protein
MSDIKTGNTDLINRSGLARIITICMGIFFLMQILFPVSLKAQGDLLITPRRVVFDGSKRSVDLNLANIGKDSATYAISIIQMRMKDDGGFETITEPDPGQRFADRYVRFFPRSVTLAPNESQVVKIQLQRNSELSDGEYRSHMYFRSVPRLNPLGTEEIRIDSSNIAIRLTPIFGITIPVIIRSGQQSYKITVTDLELGYRNDTIPSLGMTLNRSGNISVYGDILAEHISPTGKVTRLGIASGVAVYTPNSSRKFQLNLNGEADLKSGRIRVSYSAPSDVRPEQYAEAFLVLQ